MIMRIRLLALASLVLVAGAISCQTSTTGGGSGQGVGGGTNNTVAEIDPTGYFVEGTNDVEGGGAPPTPVEEAEVGAETKSHFRAIQVDPAQESSAGPKFVLHFDIDQDGLLDLVTGWNQSQPVQIHLQRRDGANKVSFVTATLGGTGPIAVIGDLDMADFNNDGWLDVAVLAKDNGSVAVCPKPGSDPPFEIIEDDGTGEIIILFNPGNANAITDGDAWIQVRLDQSQLPGRRDESLTEGSTYPEFNGYTGMAVADFDGVNGPDIVVAYNPSQCEYYGDEPAPLNRLVFYPNPGGANTLAGATWAPIVLTGNAPTVSDVKPADVDGDGDPDLIFTYPDSLTANISWLRNPLDVGGAAAALDPGNWQERPIGHVATNANVFTVGDIDGDGYADVLVRTNAGLAVQWFRHPGSADREPIFPPDDAVPSRFNFPWQVYTMSEYEIGRPAGLAIGDLTGDGLNDVAVAAGGVVYWYDGSLAPSRYERWGELFVLDDTKVNGTTDDPTDPDFVDDGTVIYSLDIVDIDGDGANDIVGTIDRRVRSGLTDDTLIWFRNTLLEEESAGGD